MLDFSIKVKQFTVPLLCVCTCIACIKAIPKMTYTVSCGRLNPTLSFTMTTNTTTTQYYNSGCCCCCCTAARSTVGHDIGIAVLSLIIIVIVIILAVLGFRRFARHRRRLQFFTTGIKNPFTSISSSSSGAHFVTMMEEPEVDFQPCEPRQLEIITASSPNVSQ